ncbi:SDR family NAD(P)-dependent oxidoreductase [Prauserella cavernicola]|uniref:SDR family oxidoreductase n=1 Tax=Prauserella cavernicola TaxID=2800127 RepID=A0A934QQD3_9PSEU|nr:SDR family oxidoreductase [Prauserella cavernicola]MBK1783494.1 SDR family oxidoreductase [Prauserella cavernicola]
MTGGRVAGKVCVVTGAAAGLGAAIARLLSEHGGIVVGFDVTPGDTGWQVDVRDDHAVARAMNRVAAEHGRIDVLVNNAGIAGPRKPSHEVSAEEFDAVFAVNVRGTWLCTKYAIPHMPEGGSVITMSSMYGLVGNSLLPVYHASKGAVRLLSKADAAAYAPRGIRVNSVHPGSIETGSATSVRQSDDETARSYNARTLAAIPLGRRGEPLDIAYGVLYLASDESRYVTGSELVIDGGYTAV